MEWTCRKILPSDEPGAEVDSPAYFTALARRIVPGSKYVVIYEFTKTIQFATFETSARAFSHVRRKKLDGYHRKFVKYHILQALEPLTAPASEIPAYFVYSEKG